MGHRHCDGFRELLMKSSSLRCRLCRKVWAAHREETLVIVHRSAFWSALRLLSRARNAIRACTDLCGSQQLTLLRS